VLTSGAALDDTLQVISYSTYQVNSQNYTGGLTVDNDGATVLTVDRASSDGTIIDLQKDGSSVGTISTAGGDVEINSASGISKNVDIIGRDTGGNARGIAVGSGSARPNADNSIDLGTTTSRFKDLYLSGGVYLGGTGSANLLDDYEEGTWTPSNANLTVASGRYIKIGQQVTIWAELTFSGSASGSTEISDLPFGVINGTWSGNIAITNIERDDVRFFVHSGQTNAYFRDSSNDNYDASTFASGFLYVSATYQTS
jgi:hypothetical protein